MNPNFNPMDRVKYSLILLFMTIVKLHISSFIVLIKIIIIKLTA